MSASGSSSNARTAPEGFFAALQKSSGAVTTDETPCNRKIHTFFVRGFPYNRILLSWEGMDSHFTIQVEKLQAHHIQAFYKSLQKPGGNSRGSFATTEKLGAFLKEHHLSKDKLAKQAGVSSATIRAAVNGKHIHIDKASLICNAILVKLEDMFTITHGNLKLSDNTIHHYHTLICSILAQAKREHIIPFNVATEQVTAPKVIHKKAVYLSKKEAMNFLVLVLSEKDIRIKAALILLLFSGMRKEELCGLSWPDIDWDQKQIHIRRASEYIRKKGVEELPTKTEDSYRDIYLPAFVFEILEDYKVWWDGQRKKYGADWQGQKQRLFIQRCGKPLHPSTINFWLNKFLERNKLKHMWPHCFRHTYATLQIAGGVDLRTMMAILGINQVDTLTKTYAHEIDSAKQAASGNFEKTLLPSDSLKNSQSISGKDV